MNLEKYELMIKRGGDRGGGSGGRADRDRVRGGVSNPGARGGQDGRAADAAGRGGRGGGRGEARSRADRGAVRGGMANPGARGGQTGQAAAAAGRGGRGGGRGQSSEADFTIGETQGTAFDSSGQALAQEAEADFARGTGELAAGEVTGPGGGRQPGAPSGQSSEEDFTIGQIPGTAFGPDAQALGQQAEEDFDRGVGALGAGEATSGNRAAQEVADRETQRAATGAVATALFDDTFGPVQETQLAQSTDVTGDGARQAVGPQGPQAPTDVPGPDRRGNGVVARQIATGDRISTGGGAGSGAVVREGLRASLDQRAPVVGRGRGIGQSRRQRSVASLLRL